MQPMSHEYTWAGSSVNVRIGRGCLLCSVDDSTDERWRWRAPTRSLGPSGTRRASRLRISSRMGRISAPPCGSGAEGACEPLTVAMPMRDAVPPHAISRDRYSIRLSPRLRLIFR